MNIKLLSAATALVLSVGTANAALLNFETGFSGDLTSLGTDEYFGSVGVTFSSPNGLNIAKVGGNPTSGFVPNDTPTPTGVFGQYFLTSDFGQVTSLFIDYDAGVSEASFDVADIDGSGSDLEVFTFTALDGSSNVLASQIIDGNNPLAGDAKAITVGFSGLSGLIKRIEITGTTSGGSRLIGIAFDNFNTNVDITTPVPLPAGLPLAMAGLGALGLLRSRRKA
jgi:hypothetical protein